ncbi:MAG: hypothetical protein ABFC63_12055 [Thermoguttaceae bacterium]
MNVTDYIATLAQEYGEQHEKVAFKAEPFYAPGADSIIFYVRDTDTYRKRLNSWVTLYLSMDDGRLAGFEVKGVKRILELASAFRVGIVDHKIKLGVLLTVALAQVTKPDVEPYASDLTEYGDREIEMSRLLAA